MSGTSGTSGIIRGIALRRATDGDVFARARRGDPAAFAETYRRYRSRVYGFCLARLLSPESAEDAVQETFVRMLSSDGADVRNPKAWLFTVARNVCVDVARRRARETPEDMEATGGPRGAAADVADEAAAARESRDALLALKRLRPRYRTALILREMHGLPVREIAESLGVREGAAHTIVSRARDAFARAFAEVSGRPERCADAVTLMFRRQGSSLDPAEEQRLEHHLAECAWCRKEHERCRGSALAALLPLSLAPLGRPRSLLARAAVGCRPVPEPLRDLTPAASPALQAAARLVVPLLMAGSLAAHSTVIGIGPGTAVHGRDAAARGACADTAAEADESADMEAAAHDAARAPAATQGGAVGADRERAGEGDGRGTASGAGAADAWGGRGTAEDGRHGASEDADADAPTGPPATAGAGQSPDGAGSGADDGAPSGGTGSAAAGPGVPGGAASGASGGGQATGGADEDPSAPELHGPAPSGPGR